jgi:hypothetical protein
VLGDGSDLVTMRHSIERLLGTAWDEELEIYRRSGDGTPMRWLSAAV